MPGKAPRSAFPPRVFPHRAARVYNGEVETLTADDLQAWLRRHGVAAEIVRLNTPTPTVQAAAEAVGAPPDHILKTVVFLAAGEPVLVVARGPERIPLGALARRLGVSRKRLRVARPEEVLAITGYPVGAVPPCGHRRPLRVLVAARVLQLPMAYAGGGAENALLRIAPADLLAATGAEVVALSSEA